MAAEERKEEHNGQTESDDIKTKNEWFERPPH